MWKAAALLLAFILLMLALFGQANAEPRDRPGWGGWGGWGGGGNRSVHHHWHGRPGYRTDPGTAFWGGVIGGALGSLFSRPSQPDVVVVPAPPQRDVSWCIQRYRSYDTYTRTYLGYDGLRHGCP